MKYFSHFPQSQRLRTHSCPSPSGCSRSPVFLSCAIRVSSLSPSPPFLFEEEQLRGVLGRAAGGARGGGDHCVKQGTICCRHLRREGPLVCLQGLRACLAVFSRCHGIPQGLLCAPKRQHYGGHLHGGCSWLSASLIGNAPN